MKKVKCILIVLYDYASHVIIAISMNLSSITTLTIFVDDINDNVPVISSCSSNSVLETNITGSTILTVSYCYGFIINI